MTGRAGLAAMAGAVLLAVGLAATAWLSLARQATVIPDYVITIPLTRAGEPVALPPVEGGDASRPLVVIDAGHGGHDPGAIGPGGLREKDVTLGLALALRKVLLDHGRVRLALTRSNDTFLTLGERPLIARRLGADMFVAIHADAAEAGSPTGATIYVLSDQASDEVAARLAARENRADQINGMALDGQSGAVSAILVDLSRSDMARASQTFSDLILREGKGVIPFHSDPQRKAAFAVLKSLDVPSVLFEAGFVSTAQDAERLRDPQWRGRFAASLSSAIEIFLAQRNAR